MAAASAVEAVPVATRSELPIIDLAPFYEPAASSAAARQAVGDKLRAACLNTGFFYVTGPAGRVPDQRPLLDAARALFALPQPAKDALAASLSPLHRGYTGLGGAHNCVPEEACDLGPDNKESFLLGAEGSASPMHGPNTWPPEELLPGWRRAVREYSAQMVELSRVVARGLALSLGLDEGFFDGRMTDPVAQLLLLRYPPLPAEPAQQQQQQQHQHQQPAQRKPYVGCGAHTDCGFLTILAQDDVPGLQVLMGGGRWVVAPPVPGAFVVNLGDLAAAWTGGRYKSTLHRVFNRSGGAARYSAPFFCNCNFDATVEPADIAGADIAGAGAAAEGPIQAGKYIMQKLGLMWEDPAATTPAAAAAAAGGGAGDGAPA